MELLTQFFLVRHSFATQTKEKKIAKLTIINCCQCIPPRTCTIVIPIQLLVNFLGRCRDFVRILGAFTFQTQILLVLLEFIPIRLFGWLLIVVRGVRFFVGTFGEGVWLFVAAKFVIAEFLGTGVATGLATVEISA